MNVAVPTCTAAAPASTPHTVTYYAFDINNGTSDPGFIAVPGTNPGVFAQGDEEFLARFVFDSGQRLESQIAR